MEKRKRARTRETREAARTRAMVMLLERHCRRTRVTIFGHSDSCAKASASDPSFLASPAFRHLGIQLEPAIRFSSIQRDAGVVHEHKAVCRQLAVPDHRVGSPDPV